MPTLDGNDSFKVPEGTQSGTVFRLRGKGMPDVSGPGPRRSVLHGAGGDAEEAQQGTTRARSSSSPRRCRRKSSSRARATPKKTRRTSSRRSKIFLGKAWPALDIHVPSCDPQLQELVLAELDDFQPTAIQEPDDTSRLRAFFTSSESRDAAARALGAAFGSHLYVESLNVEDEDWAARSQAQLQAVTVGRIVVAPPWDVRRARTARKASDPSCS